MNAPLNPAQAMSQRAGARFARTRIAVGIFLLVAASPLAQAVCTASPELSARLKAQPSSENYAAVGNWFADKKQFDCAAGAFASAFQRQSNSASLAYLWGLSLYSAGHDDQAVAPLNQAKHLDPSDIRPHLVLAAAMDRQKKTAEAETEWRAALAIDPDSATALDSLSQDFLDRKDYAAAIALLDRPGSSRLRTPQQCFNLGVAYAGTAQLDAAAKALREGLNNNPDSLPIAGELALVLMLHGRDQEAFAVLELALEKHPGDQATQILYLRTLVSSHAGKAAELGPKLLIAYPNEWEVLYLNAQLESREADFAAARAHLEHSVAVNPGYYPSHAELGSILAKLGDLAGARSHLEKAIALGDSDPEAEYDLAKVLQKLGETALAQEKMRLYQQLKQARTDKVQAAGKAEEGDQAMAAGDPAQAASLYREALHADPDEPLLSYKLSRALDKLKDIAGERAALERAIQLKPNLAEAENQLGYLAARDGDAAQAESYFRAAVGASPSYVAAWINLAATLADEGKWQDSRQALGHALEVDPDNAAARKLSQALAEAHPGP
ncbi:MAG: tetratricopeptide repeat protein [Terracidiphilus sp.]|nr:tetratricopeptide repeat protein [Terracidiphilus sp.]